MSARFQLLDLPDYREFGEATARGDHLQAIASLRRCLPIAEERGELHDRVWLLCALADAEARAGQFVESQRAFDQAEQLDPDSPLTKLYSARCLAAVVQDAEAARSKLAEAERLLGSRELAETDLSRSSYDVLVQEVRALLP